jgi:hypothetical protein
MVMRGTEISAMLVNVTVKLSLAIRRPATVIVKLKELQEKDAITANPSTQGIRKKAGRVPVSF